MVIESSPQHEAPEAFVRLRYRLAKLIYDSIFGLIVRAGSWQEELFGSLAPRAGDRILQFGRGNSSTAISLAHRYPEVQVVEMDASPEAAGKVQSKAKRNQIRNLSVVVAPFHGPLPFRAGSFDRVVCRLGLHDFPPTEKLFILKEVARVIRRGGTFHVADFDRAESPGEGSILELARRISGPAAVAAHIDGSWTEFLARSGFSSVRHQASHSIGFGRISVVRRESADAVAGNLVPGVPSFASGSTAVPDAVACSCRSPSLMLWTAPPPARECHSCGSS